MPYRHREPLTDVQLARFVLDLQRSRRRLVEDQGSFYVSVVEAWEAGASQRELADGMGVTLRTVGKWVKLGREERDRRSSRDAGRSGEQLALG